MREKFSEQIRNILGGERVLYCYQCGTCTAGCPSAWITQTYNPRQFILKALLGLRDAVVKDEKLWLCTTCHTCSERCPQDVHVDEALVVMRNIAVKEGKVPHAIKELARFVAETGRVVATTDGVNFLREKVALEPVKEIDSSDLPKILRKTGLGEVIGLKEAEE